MKRRTFEEMISYFNQTVSDMDISRKYKMTLLGIVTALLQKHDEDVAQIVRCKDCKYHSHPWYCEAWNNSPGFPAVSDDMFCSLAERRTDESNVQDK